MTTEKKDYIKEVISLKIEATYLRKRIEAINNQIQAVLLKYEYQVDDSFFIELVNEFDKTENMNHHSSSKISPEVLEQGELYQ
jgi:hypothetical protein